MEHFEIKVNDIEIPAVRTSAVIVGSGAAGWSCADWLSDFGIEDILLISEGINSGASRNTGSDKQTYHKLSMTSDEPDSVMELARDLYACGGIDGDLVLTMAANSARCFHRLVNLGIPFPENCFGEHVGYRTDHDTKRRATSVGPLTSKFMTEALEAYATESKIPALDKLTAFELICQNGRAVGLLCIHKDLTYTRSRGLFAIFAPHIVLATGGAALCYEKSVFPESQTGMTGITLKAGVRHANLNHWQYGLASTTFRWNVSGTYQQVLPRYISVDEDGNEYEFLNDYYDTPAKALDAVFRKGYEWPFDPNKTDGSSRIDMLVHEQISGLGRRVFMDFRTDPTGLANGFDELSEDVRSYLERSGALIEKPIERLKLMNPDAIELYRSHGIDITSEPLEIAVCAQHMNGGADVDIDWQTNIPGLYVIGEAAGTYGPRRPGGSALSAGQIGALRAADHVARSIRRGTLPEKDAEIPMAEAAEIALELLNTALENKDGVSVSEYLLNTRRQMTSYAAHIRELEYLDVLADDCARGADEIVTSVSLSSPEELCDLVKARDTLITQYAVVHAIKAASTCGSYGGALLRDGENTIPADASWDNYKLITYFEDGDFISKAEKLSPIPQPDNWFENVWREYRNRK